MTQQYDPRVHEDDWPEAPAVGDYTVPDSENPSYTGHIEDTPGPHVPIDHRATQALDVLVGYGQTDGAHHLRWVVDQAVRILAGPDYDRLIADYCHGEDGPETYEWDEGIAP